MRLSITILSTGLALAGCVPAPYPPSYPPAYPSPYAQPYPSPDGFTYSDGYPIETIDGYQAQFIYAPELGGWGYYDGGHRWRGAPPGMRDRLERSHPGGRGVPPFGGVRGGDGRPGPRDMPGRPGGGFSGGPGGPPNRGQQPGRPNPNQPNLGQGRPGPGGPQQQGNQPRQGGQPPAQAQQHRPPGNCPPNQPRC